MFGNGWGNDAATQGALTRADLFEGFNNQGVNDKLNDMATGLCNSFATVNSNLCQGFGGVNSNLNQGFNSVNSSIAENRFAQQQCCCETKQAIANLAAENYRNTCEITTAIHNEGAATRALIDQNTMQALRDKIVEKDQQLQTANFQLSQQAQSANLISTLRPFPQPAYITCSPYTSSGNGYCSGNYVGGSCGA